MRRLVAVGLVGALAFTFVGTPASRAATMASRWSVGKAPLALASDPATGKVYVANSDSVAPDNSGRISVVDPAMGSVTSLTTRLSANAVLVDALGRRLYASSASLSSTATAIDIFDLDSGALVRSLSGVGGFGLGLDVGAGRLFAGGYSLTVIDTATFETRATLPTPPSGPWFGVAVDAGRQRLYLANANVSAPGFFAYDYTDLDEITPVPHGPWVELPVAVRSALAVDPVRHLVFAAGSDPNGGPSSASYMIDPDTLSVSRTATMSGFPNGIALAPSVARVYVSVVTSLNARGAVYALDDATLSATEVIQTPFPPGQPLLHPDGRLYVGNYVRAIGGQSAPDSTLIALDLANHAPVFRGAVTFDPTNPQTKTVLSAIVNADDPDLRPMGAADPTTLSYEWFRNGDLIFGETGSTLDLEVADNGDHGDTITVRVTASDGQLSATANASVTVANTGPSVLVSFTSSSPETNEVLTATAVSTDVDGDPTTLSYEWFRNGALIASETGTTLDLEIAGNGDHGDTITLRVTASDGSASSTGTASVNVVNSDPSVTVSLSSSSPRTNEVLTATATGADDDSDALTYTYTWRVNGVLKRTATTAAVTDRFDLKVKGNGDKGDVVTVSVTASDAARTSSAATARATVR